MLKMKFLLNSVLFSITFNTQVLAQIKAAKINYERKTNLEKKYANSEWMSDYLEEVGKTKIDFFELYYNDTASAFYPVENEIREDLWWTTEKNTVWQNLKQNKIYAKRSIWDEEVFICDSLHFRKWKITDVKRKICGFNCRMALWKADSAHAFYAWFAPDLICSTGPESYNGLPGVILGLAKEDGSVTYFATSVSILNPEKEKLIHPTKKIKYKSTAELKEEIFKTNGRDKMYKELEVSYFKYW